MKIKPIILCGGAGTRLWPESKKNTPKQFIDFGGWTLFKKTLERIKNPIFDSPIISTNIKYLNLTKKFLLKYKIRKYTIVLEPLKKNTSAKASYFTVALQKDESIPHRDIVLARNRLLLLWNLSRQRINHRGFRAFLRVEDEPLAEMLRASEGGAHDRWSPNEPRIKAEYDLGSSTVSFINRSVGELMKLLSPQGEGVSEDELIDYFFLESEEFGPDTEVSKKKKRCS